MQGQSVGRQYRRATVCTHRTGYFAFHESLVGRHRWVRSSSEEEGCSGTLLSVGLCEDRSQRDDLDLTADAAAHTQSAGSRSMHRVYSGRNSEVHLGSFAKAARFRSMAVVAAAVTVVGAGEVVEEAGGTAGQVLHSHRHDRDFDLAQAASPARACLREVPTAVVVVAAVAADCPQLGDRVRRMLNAPAAAVDHILAADTLMTRLRTHQRQQVCRTHTRPPAPAHALLRGRWIVVRTARMLVGPPVHRHRTTEAVTLAPTGRERSDNAIHTCNHHAEKRSKRCCLGRSARALYC